MQGSRLEARLFLVGVFLALLAIAVAGWVARPFTATATWVRARRSAFSTLD
jgi:hypothetical protein